MSCYVLSLFYHIVFFKFNILIISLFSFLYPFSFEFDSHFITRYLTSHQKTKNMKMKINGDKHYWLNLKFCMSSAFSSQEHQFIHLFLLSSSSFFFFSFSSLFFIFPLFSFLFSPVIWISHCLYRGGAFTDCGTVKEEVRDNRTNSLSNRAFLRISSS